MFQFPGFALKPLCIQGKSTCFCMLMITTRAKPASGPNSLSGTAPVRSVTSRSDNNTQSGGFPHSDIHGSKPVLGSPWLFAEYHVLHRLLLPRHPPNALFALDPIQEAQDSAVLPSQRHRNFPCRPRWFTTDSTAVSVLDLDNATFQSRFDPARATPHQGRQWR